MTGGLHSPPPVLGQKDESLNAKMPVEIFLGGVGDGDEALACWDHLDLLHGGSCRIISGLEPLQAKEKASKEAPAPEPWQNGPKQTFPLLK